MQNFTSHTWVTLKDVIKSTMIKILTSLKNHICSGKIYLFGNWWYMYNPDSIDFDISALPSLCFQQIFAMPSFPLISLMRMFSLGQIFVSLVNRSSHATSRISVRIGPLSLAASVLPPLAYLASFLSIIIRIPSHPGHRLNQQTWQTVKWQT